MILIILVAIILAVIVIIIGGLSILYPYADHLKFLQKYYCKLGWHCHMKDYQQDFFDGTSLHCTCKWCGYKGKMDSQGNLF